MDDRDFVVCKMEYTDPKQSLRITYKVDDPIGDALVRTVDPARRRTGQETVVKFVEFCNEIIRGYYSR